MTSLKKQTVSGVKWLVGSSFLQKGIQLAATVVIARILGPEEFGLFALAFVAINALGLFKSMGFDSALIQRKDNIEKAANTAFFIIPTLGIVLYLILAISAPLIGKFFGNEQVVGVIRALGVIFVISCLGRVPAALLEKNMRFRQVSIIEISSAIIYALSAIIFALLKFGVWSLVYAYILKTVNKNILTFIFAQWRLRFQFDKIIAIEMFHFGKFVFLSSLVYFFRMNLDNILVGKYLGLTLLGIYAISFNISNFLSEYFTAKMEKVIYPAYAVKQSDNAALRRAYLKIIKAVTYISMPFTLIVFLFRNELIATIYGPKWLDAAPILGLLIWTCFFRMLVTSAGPLFLARGKPHFAFWLASLQVILFVILIVPLSRAMGLSGVALVVTGGTALNAIIILALCNKLIQLRLSDIFYAISGPLIVTSVMVFFILIGKSILSNFIATGSLALFFISVVFAAVSYISMLYVVDKGFMKEAKTGLLKT